jgi:hypothetical protein
MIRFVAPSVCRTFILSHRRAKTGTKEESGMEKLLGSLTGTVIAGFVLVIVMILVIHAIH